MPIFQLKERGAVMYHHAQRLYLVVTFDTFTQNKTSTNY